MPFLIITNNLKNNIEVEIMDKKSQKSQTIPFAPLESRQLLPCEFDYYMKQFTIKITLL
jgi:hypothetical protein